MSRHALREDEKLLSIEEDQITYSGGGHLSVLKYLLLFVVGIGIGTTAVLIYDFTRPTFDVPCKTPPGSPSKPKNLIILIGDGYSGAAITLTRICNNNTINLDPYLIGKIKTYSLNSWVTDSAAAATAYSTGVKSYNDAIAVNGNKTAVGTTMEAAIEAGYSTGIVVTTELYHATPASFSSHADNRNGFNFIAAQQVTKGIDLLFGGGNNQYSKPNVYNTAIQRNYNYIYNSSQLASAKLPVIGVFSEDEMNYEIDRTPQSTQPSLSQMTQKALDLMKQKDNPNGFFLLIEGSQIDIAEHDNDFPAAYREALEFDKAFQIVINYAKESKDTLVLLTADHETGGLGLGINGIYQVNTDIINRVGKSATTLANILKSSPLNESEQIFLNTTGINLTATELQSLETAINGSAVQLTKTISSLISQYALIGWTTSAHTGVDVNLYGYGPGIENFCGCLDNTDIAKRISSLFKWDELIGKITESLKNFNTTTGVI